jgi:hypothetical protein
MTEPAIDYKCYVGTYELRRPDEIPGCRPGDLPGIRRLVKVGQSKRVKPRPEAITQAVELLLKARVASFYAAYDTWERELSRLTDRFGFEAAVERMKGKPFEIDPYEYADFEKIVLAISRQLGMLRDVGAAILDEGTALSKDHIDHEPVEHWIRLADHIKRMFLSRDQHRISQDKQERSVGMLGIYLSFKSGAASMLLRPNDTMSALIYCAAQMIAKGMSLHNCKHCGTPFLGGGEVNGRKKRGDARFCTDKCRSSYHNELRRKAARKAKL